MKEVGESTLWVEKYRPRNFDDLIVPKHLKEFTENIKGDKFIPNLIFDGIAGTGKTSLAKAIVNELGADMLYLNCSIDNSINDVRGKIHGFATANSIFSDEGVARIAILDEFERFPQHAQDALKALIEETESTCRYIFITNNIQKVIAPLISRTQSFSFGLGNHDKKDMVKSIYKRVIEILDLEGVKYDPKVLAEFVTKIYPDFRKTINELQKFSKCHGEINRDIFNVLDDNVISDLITELKNKKFSNIRKMATAIDPNSFYTSFYKEMDEYLDRSCIPDVIVLLAEFNYRDAICTDREINLMAFLVEIAGAAKWK